MLYLTFWPFIYLFKIFWELQENIAFAYYFVYPVVEIRFIFIILVRKQSYFN